MDDYIKAFHEESSTLEDVEKVQEIRDALNRRNAREIFLVLERYRVIGDIKTPRFEEMLTNFYWQFVA